MRGGSGFVIVSLFEEVQFIFKKLDSPENTPMVVRLCIRLLGSALETIQYYMQDAVLRRYRLGEVKLSSEQMRIVAREYKKDRLKDRPNPFQIFKITLDCYLIGRRNSENHGLVMFPKFTKFRQLRNRITHATSSSHYEISKEDVLLFLEIFGWFWTFTESMIQVETEDNDSFQEDIQKELQEMIDLGDSEEARQERLKRFEPIKVKLLADLKAHRM